MPHPALAPLRALLATHSPLDETEVGHQRRMIELADAGLAGVLAPFARTTFAPGHFTASSFVLGPELDSVLLILHAKLGFWMQPGGHIDPDDPDILSAARRELAEETGLHGLALWPEPATPELLDLDIHPIPARRDEPRHEHFDLRFLFHSPTSDLIDSHEVRGARWVPLGGIEQVRSDASVMRAVARIRQRVRGRRP
jgi:8-oxo-dGTP pyrophosphatase MutT (NUDIX family)